MDAFHAEMLKALGFVVILIAWTAAVEWALPEWEAWGILGQTLAKSLMVLVPVLVLLWKLNISEDVNSLLRKAGAQIRQML